MQFIRILHDTERISVQATQSNASTRYAHLTSEAKACNQQQREVIL